jgi:hypothetical protein
MRFKIACCGLLLACLSACQPEPTPFPVDIPTPATATPTPGAPAPIRYALAPNTLNAVADRDLIESSAQVTQLSEAVNLDSLGSQFDLIATYGSYPNATPSPSVITLSLRLNTSLAPLDDPTLADILLHSIDPAALAAQMEIPGVQAIPYEVTAQAALRADLANAGWPDGIDLSLAHENVIAVTALQTYWQGLNIHLNVFPLQDLRGPTHLTLFAWTTPEQRAAFAEPNSGMIDLLTVPISYWAVPSLQIRYSPQGWPIATRP